MVGRFVSTTKEKSLWIPHVKIVCCDVALKNKNDSFVTQCCALSSLFWLGLSDMLKDVTEGLQCIYSVLKEIVILGKV